MRKIILFFVCTIMFSCKKSVNCDGIVYSRHNIPIPNATVKLNIYTTSSSYPTYFKQTQTDQNGHYAFSEKIRKKFYLSLECQHDSGYARDAWGKWDAVNGKSFNLHLK